MGLLDQVMGGLTSGAQQPDLRQPSAGSTVVAGIVLALAVKAARQYINSSQSAPTTQPGATSQPSDGAPISGQPQPGGVLGNILGGGGVSGILASLGGSGALNALISHLQQKGLGQQVNSWVGSGQNEPVEPHQLGESLGDDTLNALQQKTGLPRDSLLTELARVLPQAVHEITPEGRPPTDAELHAMTALNGPSSAQ
jgi:uncharacterized protein YidB (DUF937 family)